MNVRHFLDEAGVAFDVIPHRATCDAQRMSKELRLSGKHVAKTVLLRADHGYRYLVAVVPACRRVDLTRASPVLGGSELEIASESELIEHCPDCDAGVLPPFGSQYGMRTLVDADLLDDEWIVFEGNTHDEAIRMRTSDFRRLECPLIARFADPSRPMAFEHRR